MSDGTMNTRIVDSVTTNATLLTGQAPSQAFGILDTVMAETLGMSMHNAVMRQQADGMVSAAATTAACAKMLQTPYTITLPPLPPIPPLGPQIEPVIPPPASPSPAPMAAITQAVVDGEAALAALKNQFAEAQIQAALIEAQVAQAEAELVELANAAAPTPPTPPPPAPSPPVAGRKT
jgi:hypothetical protein